MSEDNKNVLLVYPEFPYSFWSLSESCRISGVKAPSPPLGLLTVAALLPSTWEIRLADLNTRKLEEKDWAWADMVMVSGMLVQHLSMTNIMTEAQKRGIPLVAGGPVTTGKEEVMLDSGCTYLVSGEGETSIPLFLKGLTEGLLSGVFNNSDKPDLTSSPIPRYDLLDFSCYDSMAIQTSRGCPFDCEFCDIVALFGRKPRYKKPEQVISELEYIYELGWRGSIFVVDDNFIGNRKHAREILELLIPWNKDRGEPFGFYTQASINLGQDQEMIDMMTSANFGMVFVGLETPSEEILKQNHKFQNVQHSLVDSVVNITQNGLTVQGSFILGFDNEETGAGQRISEFVETTAIPFVMLNMLFALPNTRFWTRLKEENRLLEDLTVDDWAQLRTNFITQRPLEEIQREFIEAWEYLYDPSRYLARVYRHCLTIRPTRKAMKTEEKQESPPKAKVNAPGKQSNTNRQLLAFLNILWRQGIRNPARWQFWKQLIGILRHNPSRFTKYMTLCAMGEDMFVFRKIMLDIGRKLKGNY